MSISVNISPHPVILFSDDDLLRAKYITIKTNYQKTEEARKQFHDKFISKQVFHQLDSNIHVADPNQNYEILEKARKGSFSGFCEGFPAFCFPWS